MKPERNGRVSSGKERKSAVRPDADGVDSDTSSRSSISKKSKHDKYEHVRVDPGHSMFNFQFKKKSAGSSKPSDYESAGEKGRSRRSRHEASGSESPTTHMSDKPSSLKNKNSRGSMQDSTHSREDSPRKVAVSPGQPKQKITAMIKPHTVTSDPPVNPTSASDRRISTLEDLVHDENGIFRDQGDVSVNSGLTQPNLSQPADSDRPEVSNVLSGFGAVRIACVVDGNVEQYQMLQNAPREKYVTLPLTSTGLKYCFPQNLTWLELFPGVYSCITAHVDGVKTGYLRLDARTVKPLEKTGSGILILSVMEGKVSMKSTAYNFDSKGQPFLNSVDLFEGCIVSVSANSIYSIENWGTEEASLQFTVIKTAD